MLKRRKDTSYEDDIDGVWFYMSDRDDKVVRCLVSRGSIQDRLGGHPTNEQRERCFLDNRDRIESVASTRFAGGLIEPLGYVLVEVW